VSSWQASAHSLQPSLTRRHSQSRSQQDAEYEQGPARKKAHLHRSSSPTQVTIDSVVYTTRDGLMPVASKLRIIDYKADMVKLIKKACGYYNLKILTVCPFPSQDQAETFARNSWDHVCQEAKKNYSPEDSARIYQLVSNTLYLWQLAY
jgi:hypothetical protein